ncbi:MULTISPECIES: PD-(D/E)XK nuclease family protein [unclassified Micromonospora]|uniref:PD-(D/E)XK nuclease family protein n=1 Tax=unclassified Micromonospora TaxID=2617518 RepID=UPI002FF426BC
MIADEQRLRELAAEWDTVNRTQVGQWEKQLRVLATEAAAIKAAGQWRAGPRTLLEVLGVHELERKLVTCLAWVLQPEGHHRLGNRVVKGLFGELGLPFDPTARVRVSREETRFTPDGKRTPADLIVRAGRVCVLLEAKVNAGEHGDQCARLARLWANEATTLVYLTRDRDEPGGSVVPAGWNQITWRHITGLMAPLPDDASAGARDFLETLQMLNGE